MTAEAQKKDLPMMVGSNGGPPTYLAFARNDPFVLGVKPVLVANGAGLNMPGHTWFVARLRSAPSDFFKEADNGNVITFKKDLTSHEEAWPAIAFEKSDKKRASTAISVFIEGTPETREGALKLIAEIENKKLANKMTDYLWQLAGDDHVKIDRETVVDWFEVFTVAFVQSLKIKVSMLDSIHNEMMSQVGVMGMHANTIKKISQKAQEEAAAHASEPDDQ